MSRIYLGKIDIPVFTQPGRFQEHFLLLLSKQVDKSLGNKISNTVQKRATTSVNKEYRNLMKNLSNQLKKSGMKGSGAEAVELGGEVNLTCKSTTGKNISLPPRIWPGLDPYYRTRKPRSFRFWYKFGRLYDAFSSLPQVSVDVAEIPSARNHHKGKINLSYKMDFSTLPQELRTLKIAESFIQAVKLAVYRKGIPVGNRQGLGRAVIPETTRGWMRDMAAALGEDMRKNLRRL